MSGFNYSKWDNIELSDDESDLHPNIDKESWFRMKHRSRLEREDREDKEKTEIAKLRSEFTSRLKIINARLKAIENGTAGEDAEFEDVDALKSEAAEIESNFIAFLHGDDGGKHHSENAFRSPAAISVYQPR